MERWELPAQEALAAAVCPAIALDVLEVGYGLGMASREIQRRKVASHWIIEMHPEIARTARSAPSTEDVVLLVGTWECIIPKLKSCSFDGIVFDGYPFDSCTFNGDEHGTADHAEPFLFGKSPAVA